DNDEESDSAEGEEEEDGEAEEEEGEDEEAKEEDGEDAEMEDEEGEDEDEEEEEGEDEEMEEDEDISASVAPGSVEPVAPIGFGGSPGPARIVPIPGGPATAVPATAPVPSIAILPATPVKIPARSPQVVPGENQDEQHLIPDIAHDEQVLKRGREHSGSGESQITKATRRSTSHSTAPTVPPTSRGSSDDEDDLHGASRTTGGFIRGRAIGNNFN
ncbi:hypothetical protein PILCRDRAFT_1641, partial [Piloderma croceum F 1598]